MNRSHFLTTSGLAMLGVLAEGTPSRAATGSSLAPVLAAQSWIGRRVTTADLHGRVVLVDVFTFECINCVRVTPNLQKLSRTYRRSDLAIVGIHTPEVPSYQGRLSYVRERAERANIDWPVALDNDYRIWQAYGIDAWPTQLVFDRAGTLRATIVGDSRDAELDRAIARLV